MNLFVLSHKPSLDLSPCTWYVLWHFMPHGISRLMVLYVWWYSTSHEHQDFHRKFLNIICNYLRVTTCVSISICLSTLWGWPQICWCDFDRANYARLSYSDARYLSTTSGCVVATLRFLWADLSKDDYTANGFKSEPTNHLTLSRPNFPMHFTMPQKNHFIKSLTRYTS